MPTALHNSAHPLKVLHFVSSGAEANPAVGGVLLPLVVRGDRRSVQTQVVHFIPGHPYASVIRQSGVPVHELKLSTRRWSLLAPRELAMLTAKFKPDVVHAWDHTAQLASLLMGDKNLRRIWTMGGTDPLPPKPTQLARLKLKSVLKFADRAHRLVFGSEAALSRHRRAGFSTQQSMVIAPGVDTERYKPDFAARKRVREQLGLGADAFVIGMQAPFQPEYDHVTFFKAAGDLIRANPHLVILLAGRGVQRGNAPLMALVGGGSLASRVRLLGEWSDSAALFNACDAVCSSALTDGQRTTLAMAMLCGVPCVATGLGAQGEVLGSFGVSVEAGSQASLTRGITRLMEMPLERRAFLARGARQHALAHFNLQHSIQRYHALYRDDFSCAEAPQDAVTPALDRDLTAA